ncbi:hypothetical protein SAMN04487977_104319 [Treponema bryantii]|uniref:O-antigen ligase like membrane protein n=1 Tax=Treponema bryantii TaxID=163 RepID=A0A1H9G8D6_9SPIR|nr:O-antigen polymerase [Treponema bryantii]SEQ46371.1 hypothetical protein SAMN04487977_104319 [Treponema bryantii]
MNRNSIFINYIIYIGLLFYLLIDTIAGILISKGFPNIGLLIKVFLILLMIINVSSKNFFYPVIISFFFSLLFIYAVYWFFIDNKFFSISFSNLFKIFAVMIIFIYCKNELSDDQISQIIKVNYIIFVANILLGSLGFGNNPYKYNGETVGTNGFFYSGNEITYTYICLLFLIIYTNRDRKTLFYLFNIFLSVLIGTKTGMLVVLLVLFSDMYFSTKNIIKKRLLIIAFIVSITLLFFLIKKFLMNNILVQMIIFKFNQSNRGSFSILNALLSGRIERIPVIREIYTSSWSFIKYLMGLGFVEVNKHPLEMDFFEMFYYYGIFGVIVLIIFYIYLLINAYKRRDLKQFSFIIITIIVSFFVGHVTYSVMGGVFFCLCNRNLKNIRINFGIKKKVNKVFILLYK